MTFYVLCSPPADQANGFAVTDYTPVDPVAHGEAPKCPDCNCYLALMPWLAPRSAQLEAWTDRYGDVAFGPTLALLVSEVFVQRYRKAGLDGLKGFEPVAIARVKRKGKTRPPAVPPPYQYAVPVLSKTKLDLDASGMETEQPFSCDACRSAHILRYARVAIEPGTWTGEDIFFARGLPGVIIASQRFADWFHANEISNGRLVPAQEYSKDFYPAR